MTALLIFGATFSLICVLLTFLLPSFLRPSPEAERMLLLVRSEREDKRQISLLERLTTPVTDALSRIRSETGLGGGSKLQKRLQDAGLRSKHAADFFLAAQVTGLAGGAAIGFHFAATTYFWTFGGVVVGYMAPDMWLSSRGNTRREQIRKAVPDAVDLLVICVNAGLGLDQALVRVGEELQISHPHLSAEFGRLTLERRAGKPRLDAWNDLAARTRVSEFSSFVTMLAETDRFGTPITTALATFSDELRLKRRQHAEEAAAKTKVKIIFPLVLCIFPCLFIVLLAPAVLATLDSLKMMTR